MKAYYEVNKEREYIKIRRYQKTLRGYTVRLVGNIKQRCGNKNHIRYKHYNSRDIQCLFTSKELYGWLVENDIDPRGLDIHRIDNNRDYVLGNITFLSKSEHTTLHNLQRVS